MKYNRAKLENSITRREFSIYWRGLPGLWNDDSWFHGKREPSINRRGNYRSINDCKSWKNYRKYQWRNYKK